LVASLLGFGSQPAQLQRSVLVIIRSILCHVLVGYHSVSGVTLRTTAFGSGHYPLGFVVTRSVLLDLNLPQTRVVGFARQVTIWLPIRLRRISDRAVRVPNDPTPKIRVSLRSISGQVTSFGFSRAVGMLSRGDRGPRSRGLHHS